MSTLLFIIYTICSLLLLGYGLNAYVMIALFLSNREARQDHETQIEQAFLESIAEGETVPAVTTQIPLYNEINVAERVIRAVAAIRYPQGRHEIQILDDSSDETSSLVDKICAELSAEGHLIEVVRRSDRRGYKAGALEIGMQQSSGELIAIFDSDFVPPPDFLERTVPHLVADEKRALVQARWGHLNENESFLTKAQSMGVDGHFVIEQTARSRNGLFMNFCGTAGLWKKEAIIDSGGWQHDTVTEDLDLSYRAQLRGWKFYYLPSLIVPAELPGTYAAFKSQQFRWAKGSIQTARKMLPSLWKSKVSLAEKVEGSIHLTHYSLHFLMAILALLVLPTIYAFREEGMSLYQNWLFLSLLIPASLGPSLGYLICIRYAYPEDWKKRIFRLPFLLLIGFGICLSNAKAVLSGLFGSDTTFVRTPKAGENSNRQKNYKIRRETLPLLELLFAAYTFATAIILLQIDRPALIPFIMVYAAGFLIVGWNSLRENS